MKIKCMRGRTEVKKRTIQERVEPEEKNFRGTLFNDEPKEGQKDKRIATATTKVCEQDRLVYST